MNRRHFLAGMAGILASGTAPAFVPMGSLMVPRRVRSGVTIIGNPRVEVVSYRVSRGHSSPLLTWEDLATARNPARVAAAWLRQEYPAEVIDFELVERAARACDEPVPDVPSLRGVPYISVELDPTLPDWLDDLGPTIRPRLSR
jgi:hypothetical protein